MRSRQHGHSFPGVHIRKEIRSGTKAVTQALGEIDFELDAVFHGVASKLVHIRNTDAANDVFIAFDDDDATVVGGYLLKAGEVFSEEIQIDRISYICDTGLTAVLSILIGS